MIVTSKPMKWKADVACSSKRGCGWGATVYAEDIEVMSGGPPPAKLRYGVTCQGCGRWLPVRPRYDARQTALTQVRETVPSPVVPGEEAKL